MAAGSSITGNAPSHADQWMNIYCHFESIVIICTKCCGWSPWVSHSRGWRAPGAINARVEYETHILGSCAICVIYYSKYRLGDPRNCIRFWVISGALWDRMIDGNFYRFVKVTDSLLHRPITLCKKTVKESSQSSSSAPEVCCGGFVSARVYVMDTSVLK